MIFDKDFNRALIQEEIRRIHNSSDESWMMATYLALKHDAATLRFDTIESVMNSGIITNKFIFSVYRSAYCAIVQSNAAFFLAKQGGKKRSIYAWRSRSLIRYAETLNDIINYIFEEYKNEIKE